MGSFFKKAMPYLAALFLRFVYGGLFIIAKRALNQGMNHFTFTVYRNATATVVFGPIALVFERSLGLSPTPHTIHTRMTRPILPWIFLLGLFGVLDQILYYAGMMHTTADLAATFVNFLPVISFLLAWLLGLEKVKFRSLHGQAKVIGTLVSFCGVLAMIFIKGPVSNCHGPNTNPPLLQMITKIPLEAKTLETYPARLSLTAMICVAIGVQGFIASVVFEKGIKLTIWSIHWDIKLLAYVYGGILGSGLATYISGYILQERGPVFLISFNPLTTLFVASVSSFILAEQLDLGKVVGTIVIVIGVSLVLWGKTKDDHSSSSTVHAEEELTIQERINSSMNDGSQATTSNIV